MSKMSLNFLDIVYCSTSASAWVGYVSTVFSDGSVIVSWWYPGSGKFSETIRFNPADCSPTVVRVGSMPDLNALEEWFVHVQKG